MGWLMVANGVGMLILVMVIVWLCSEDASRGEL